MTYSATGIVLRRQDAHEWDRFYTIYTREHGKLFLVGKGTRRPRAKLAAHVEPLHEAELEIAHGRQIDRIIFARTLRTNEAFAQSHAHFTHASFLCECVDALTKSNHQDPAIFDLLQVALLAVRDAHPALAPAFIVRLIALLGYAPDLRQCIECRTPFRDRPATALPHRGGASCLPCSSPASRGGVRGGAGMYPPPLPGGELEGV
ncbi:MAG: DNA repair protein RecO, partial [bacterium]|nr:DNA repair protein RecO [bacterium]